MAWAGGAMPWVRPIRHSLVPPGRSVSINYDSEIEETIADLAKTYEPLLEAIKRPGSGILQLVFKNEVHAQNAILSGIKCMGCTLQAKMSEECKPTWITTSGLSMADSHGKVINNILCRYGIIVKETRKKVWKGTKIWTTEWETLMFLKDELPRSVDIQGEKAYFRHRNMTKQCYKCGSLEHLARDCVKDISEANEDVSHLSQEGNKDSDLIKDKSKDLEIHQSKNSTHTEDYELNDKSKDVRSWSDQIEGMVSPTGDIVILEKSMAPPEVELKVPEVTDTPVGEPAKSGDFLTSTPLKELEPLPQRESKVRRVTDYQPAQPLLNQVSLEPIIHTEKMVENEVLTASNASSTKHIPEKGATIATDNTTESIWETVEHKKRKPSCSPTEITQPGCIISNLKPPKKITRPSMPHLPTPVMPTRSSSNKQVQPKKPVGRNVKT